MQMALGVTGSYIKGGTSAAVNLRDPAGASIVFISPPTEERRKAQEGWDVVKHQVKPALDPDNYKPLTVGAVLGKKEAPPERPPQGLCQLQQEGRTMRNVIGLGENTSHGRKVVSTSAAHFETHGVPMACVGDACSCPISGHTNCTITTASPHHLVGDKRIAIDNDALSCGAKLISSLEHFRTSK